MNGAWQIERPAGYGWRWAHLGHVYLVSDVQSVLDSWNVETVRDDFEHCIWRYRDVDSLIADGADGAAVYEQYGKLYAECGMDLFTAREQLRSGERRTEFLDEYTDAISELAELIVGSD